jgi:hypothetical protein
LKEDNIKVLITDLIDGPTVFNLLSDKNDNSSPLSCIRYISFGNLYNEKMNQIVSIVQMVKDPKIRETHEKFINDLYVLKYKPVSNSKELDIG